MMAIRIFLLMASFLILKITSQDVLRAHYHHEILFPNKDELFNYPETLFSNYRLRSAGNVFAIPALHSVNLFTPNTIQQPAETPGQFENYRKALEEEARQAERIRNSITYQNRNIGLIGDRQLKSYVSVELAAGRKRYNYGYMV